MSNADKAREIARTIPARYNATSYQKFTNKLTEALDNAERQARQDERRKMEQRIDELEDRLFKINNWCNAYPLDVFPEPDFGKAARVLKEHGMTLDSISASNMRHVVEGIKTLSNAGGEDGGE